MPLMKPLALADKSQVHYLVTGDKRAGILSLGKVGKPQIQPIDF